MAPKLIGHDFKIRITTPTYVLSKTQLMSQTLEQTQRVMVEDMGGAKSRLIEIVMTSGIWNAEKTFYYPTSSFVQIEIISSAPVYESNKKQQE